MIIRFNSTMKTEGLNISHINNTILDIFIEPALFRHLNEDEFNMSALNLTWNATYFNNTDLTI